VELKIQKKIKPHYLIVLLLLGIILMIFSNQISQEKVGDTTQLVKKEQNSYNKYEDIENRLADIIRKIEGVDDCDVFITFENNGVKKHITNTSESTTSSEGSLSSKKDLSAVMEKKSGSESPYISEETMPEIRGVLIVAKGTRQPKIDKEITSAVSAVLGVSLHKVKILPAK